MASRQAMGSLAAARARLARRLRRQARAFQRLARKVCHRPDADGLHDLRVLTRRLRAGVWAWRRLAPEAAGRRLRRDLRTVGQALGELRALDVALSDAAEFGLPGQALARRRPAAVVPVGRELKPARRNALARALRAAAGQLETPSRNCLPPALEDRAKRLRRALARAPAGKRQMHQLRIEAKKARYVLGALGRDGGFLRELQDHLGRAHDLEVLQRLLGRNPRVAAAEALARRAARKVMAGLVKRGVRELRRAARELR